MTAPGGAVDPASSFPTLPDGTPNFPAAGAGAASTGTTSIWNLPKGLPGEIWFDIGHKNVTSNQVLRGPGGRAEDSNPVTTSEAYRIMKSPQQVMAQFAAMSYNNPTEYLALQRALAAGPWGSVNPTGAFDKYTESALSDALAQYVKLSLGAGVGVSFTQYLIQTGERAQQLGGKGTSLGSSTGSGGSQGVVAVTDPASIRQAAQSAAQQALGEGLSADQLDKFVAQFQAAQTAAQTAPGGSTVTSPDLSAQAMSFAQDQDPEAYAQNQRQVFLNSLVNMLSGPGAAGRPNMQATPKA